MPGSDKSDDLHGRVVRSVRERWENQKIPALLSWLGNLNGAELSRVTKEHGVTVRQYLTDRLSDQVAVVQHQTKKELIGVVPIGIDVAAEGGEDDLLERVQRQETSTIPRFHPAFWAAFRKPIENSKRRFVTDVEPIRFKDVSSHDEELGIEIGREYITGSDSDPSEIQRKIEDWLEDHDVDSEIYLSARQERPAEPRDLLDLVLDSLEPSELKRVTMPLDVILKLRRRLL